ncbi:MAG: hypothetical protein NTU79_19815 [Planctomycetota bacterium]|nr:hypothetical protein [Planctomycetota bacterium]
MPSLSSESETWSRPFRPLRAREDILTIEPRALPWAIPVRPFGPLGLRMRAKRVQRRDAWLTPLTIDERSSAFKGAMPSKSGKRASDKGFLGMSFELYLKLLDWTGRQIRRDHKKGRIPADLAPIMERVGLSGELWCDLVKRFGKIFKRVAGKPESLAQKAILRGRTGYRTGSSPLPSSG